MGESALKISSRFTSLQSLFIFRRQTKSGKVEALKRSNKKLIIQKYEKTKIFGRALVDLIKTENLYKMFRL